jgi:hypothetical protein
MAEWTLLLESKNEEHAIAFADCDQTPSNVPGRVPRPVSEDWQGVPKNKEHAMFPEISNRDFRVGVKSEVALAPILSRSPSTSDHKWT